MIGISEVMPLLLEACPSFVPSWREHQAERRWASGLLVDLDRFAEHLVWLIEHDQLSEFPAIFAALDQIRHNGDHGQLRACAVEQVLQGIQRHAAGTAVTLAALQPMLPPSGRRFWEAALENPAGVEDLLSKEERDRPLGEGHGRRSREFYRGCLLGGAVGDALGAPVEFRSLQQIRAQYGPHGIADFAPAYGKVGAITDDTQMTLFTAEGLLRAKVRAEQRGTCSIVDVVYHAYLRWLRTQGEALPRELDPLDGWLFGVPELHDRRAPGNTCLSALRAPERGSRAEPRNDSKGCGGVMRMAPAGLVQGADSFELGCDLAALTHGHPSGYLAAGAFAAIVREIIEGRTLLEAVEVTLRRLAACPSHEECRRALRGAVDAWRAGPPGPKQVAALGEGWVAEEALAIGVYCALAGGQNFEAGVRLAVNHDGDSDSTGAMTGNLLGALLGESAIPRRWLDQLELRREIEQVADDMLAWFRPEDSWWRRYPGW
jgi:ADP-ribosyl-[dinitrogen reductase] hydrolase